MDEEDARVALGETLKGGRNHLARTAPHSRKIDRYQEKPSARAPPITQLTARTDEALVRLRFVVFGSAVNVVHYQSEHSMHVE